MAKIGTDRIDLFENVDRILIGARRFRPQLDVDFDQHPQQLVTLISTGPLKIGVEVRLGIMRPLVLKFIADLIQQSSLANVVRFAAVVHKLATSIRERNYQLSILF